MKISDIYQKRAEDYDHKFGRGGFGDTEIFLENRSFNRDTALALLEGVKEMAGHKLKMNHPDLNRGAYNKAIRDFIFDIEEAITEIKGEVV